MSYVRYAMVLSAALFLILPLWLMAKVDLVTLPKRDTVQLTIYNSADLTLVKEQRELTVQKGINRLQFSWANTLIDPTSLEMVPKAEVNNLEVATLQYPARTSNLGVWIIQSKVSGKVPVEISYLTSGLGWRAYYLGTLSEDEKKLRVEGFVRVANASGEDYADAQTRLIVGKVHLIDEIAALARRQDPYGRPQPLLPPPPMPTAALQQTAPGAVKGMMRRAALERPKAIVKEGLSEYFLYTIEGRETIPDGWSKRLPSFTAHDVPVVNLYKYEEEQYGTNVVRFLNFKNDKDHKLGETPIPGGMLRVFREIDATGYLSYEGQSLFKYIPVGEDIELNLGVVQNVVVRPTLMDYRTDHYVFDQWGNISGWDEIRTCKIEVKNTRSWPVRIEIKRNFYGQTWSLKPDGDYGDYSVVDKDTVKFILALDAKAQKEFRYEVTKRCGSRALR